MKRWLVAVFAIGSLMLGACSNEENNHEGHESTGEQHKQHEAHGDIREETASMDEMPSFLQQHNDDMKALYVAAAKHKEVLENIPCYCGCADEAIGHRSNYDCFVHETKENGAIVWDDHGTKCQVCLDIAAQSILDFKDGKVMKEIRNDIDEQYKEGYAKPTPTPEV
ncbi:PCYCGC motif-containing (lipo)protein [Metabacillus iocasae]|uniref:Outer membrane murein-binding lipoprotein Lpp n=1 Tax=Priestia iocasae TaxID=2291674 RepID=A0ABS2QUJ6_9BACI|nr:PCYCGC motif-containing (lipo)protein [Metabacillus iocasae]MBM7703124.1 outer membrane murein-binding lipoprotein Lpp [Metabacillus iocasae]